MPSASPAPRLAAAALLTLAAWGCGAPSPLASGDRPPRVDLWMDSDNDGALDAEDAAAEDDPARVGALVALNDDDDGDGRYDAGGDGGFPDDDLEELRVLGPARGTVRLEARAGGEAVRLWADREKSREVALPVDLPAADLPAVLYVEGVGWEDAPTVLVATHELDGAVSTDELRLYVGPLAIDIDPEYPAGEPGYVAVSGLPPGAEVAFEVYRDGTYWQTVTEVADGFTAGAPLPYVTKAGTVLHVRALADGGAVVLESDSVTVVPGPPEVIELEIEIGFDLDDTAPPPADDGGRP